MLCAKNFRLYAFADFAYLVCLFAGFDFVGQFDAGAVTDRALASAVIGQASKFLSAMMLCHSILLVLI
jgi:hypothetical protein